MPSQETLWKDRRTKERPKVAEVKQSQIPLGIFIDDEDTFAEAWEECFRIPGFATIRPEIPEFLDRKTRDEIAQKIIDFTKGLTEEQLERAAVVVADQFYDNWELREAVTEFVTKLRGLNKEAFILETSGDPYGLVYPESNAVLTNGLWPSEAQSLIELSPMLPIARLNAIQLYSNPSFIQAGLADPSYSEKGGYDFFSSDSSRSRSFDRLDSKDEFIEVKKLLGLNPNSSLYNLFRSMKPAEQRLLLHYGWNIVGHMQIGNGAEYYGGSLSRLKELFNR